MKEKIKIFIEKNEEELGKSAARSIVNQLRLVSSKKKKIAILFASAPSQHSTWKHLIKNWKTLSQKERESLSRKIVAFHMDEYLGLKNGAKQIFGEVLRKNLFKKIGLKNVVYFDSTLKLSESGRYIKKMTSEFLKYKKFDMVLGGIGKLPHIAFNDPPEAKFKDRLIKIVKLREESRKQQVIDKEFNSISEVPEYAITFSLTPIFSADKIYIMVPQKFKAEAVKQTLDNKISEKIPSSGLRQKRVIKKVELYLTKDAASLSEYAKRNSLR